jgi:hypothetical protein
MNGWLDLIPLLGGGVVGAAASWATTTLVERHRWRRGYATRWDQLRLEAYSDYAAPVAESMTACARLAATLGLAETDWGRGMHPVSVEEGLSTLADLERIRSSRWQKVLLLGDAHSVSAARAWHQAVWQIIWYARGMKKGAAEFRRAYLDAVDARDAFFASARDDLGVARGPIPAYPEFPLSWMEVTDPSTNATVT